MQLHKPFSLVTPLVFVFFILLSNLNVAFVTAGPRESPFTPKAYLIRYWNKTVQNDAERPSFLLSKASPLSAADAAAFAKLAAENALSTRLPEFCSSANLLCSSLVHHDYTNKSFATYSARNFTTYKALLSGGSDSFKNYSVGENRTVDSFRHYSANMNSHTDNFTNYGSEAEQVDQSFASYGFDTVDGAGNFIQYGESAIDPNLRFNSYSEKTNARAHSFESYNQNASDGGRESFASYSSKGASWSPNEFTGYGGDSAFESGFSRYSETETGGNDRFANYGRNDSRNDFNSYGKFAKSFQTETFTSYGGDNRSSGTGNNTFKSYGRNSSVAVINFVGYGRGSNNVSDKFTGYNEQWARDSQVGFNVYGKNDTFENYAKEGVNFSSYNSNSTSAAVSGSGSLVKRWVEPGKFFRESMLKAGVVMPMPDIRDKMPKRSFLPRTISSKLPFATSKIADLKRIFHVADNSAMEKTILDALQECERAPSPGETKRCVASAEDMIDFATSVLGRNVVVRTTDSVNGSNHNVMVGAVKGINGGKVTKSVSCHQSLFPYLLYYCHSVPKVRVYEADLLDPTSKAKINHGVAICHIDTSAWSPTHGAFVALGSGPGRIEVCHWIFQNDMTWAIAD